MINASNNFITAVGDTSRTFRARFLLSDDSVLDCEIAKIGCYKGSCASELSIGCIYAPYIEATLKRCNVSLDGVELRYQIGLLVDSSYEYITLGKYKVLDASKGNGSVQFTAVGTLGQVGNNTYASALTYPATVSAVVSELATALGKTISFQGITVGNYTIASAITGQVRDVLGTIAGLYGGFVSEDQNGNIVIAAYNSGESLSVLPFRTQSIPAVRETSYDVTGIHITITEASEDEEGQTIPEVYYEYGDPIIFQQNEWMTQELFNQVVANFVGLSFDLASIEMSLGDPRLEPWDIIVLTDLQENTHNVPCFEIVHTFDGGFSTEIVAEVTSTDAETVRIKGALEKYVKRLDSDVVRAKVAADQATSILADMQTAATEAGTTLEGIYATAEEASSTLASMQDAATAAGTTLTRIYQDAEDAQSSAANANNAASSAQAILSDVEKVVDALNWIAEHGEIEQTEDRAAIDGKFYFDANKTQVTPTPNPHLQGYYELATATWTVSTDEMVDLSKNYFIRHGSGTAADPYYYELVDPIGEEDPSEEGWYELSADTYQISSDTSVVEHKLYFSMVPAHYELTSDTEVVSGKTYYTRSSAEPYTYTAVTPVGDENPAASGWYEYVSITYDVIKDYVADPYALGLYELDRIDASISNYVASHVSLDGGGLVIQTDGIKSKVRIDGLGVHLINEIGDTIATFSEDITLGDVDGINVTLSPANGLQFKNGSVPVSYINSSTMMITQAEVTNSLRIGEFLWVVQEHRISLVYNP